MTIVHIFYCVLMKQCGILIFRCSVRYHFSRTVRNILFSTHCRRYAGGHCGKHSKKQPSFGWLFFCVQNHERRGDFEKKEKSRRVAIRKNTFTKIFQIDILSNACYIKN